MKQMKKCLELDNTTAEMDYVLMVQLSKLQHREENIVGTEPDCYWRGQPLMISTATPNNADQPHRPDDVLGRKAERRKNCNFCRTLWPTLVDLNIQRSGCIGSNHKIAIISGNINYRHHHNFTRCRFIFSKGEL